MKAYIIKITAVAMTLILALTLMPPAAPPASAYGDMGQKGYHNTFSVCYFHGAAIASNGDLYTWGVNNFGQLGLGDIGKDTDRLTPTRVPGISNVVSVSLGHIHSAALTASGDLYTWGDNEYGQLGLGNKGEGTERTKPTKVPGISNVVSVCLGAYFSAAITADGSLYMWGANDWGKLGLGDIGRAADRTVPTKVPGISNVVAISMGYHHSAAVTANGDLYTWGHNRYGQLGLGDSGNTTSRYTPTKVPGISNVVAVSLGFYHSSATTSDGLLYTWGLNGVLQLGNDYSWDGAPEQKETPTLVPFAWCKNVLAVSMGAQHGAAIVPGGSSKALYIWGYDEVLYREFEDSLDYDDDDEFYDDYKWSFTIPYRSLPSYMSSIPDVVAISMGHDYSAAFDFGVTWDGAKNTIVIYTSIGYTPE